VDKERGRAPSTPYSALDAARLAVGSTLARLRRRNGITGQQLGQIVGMSQAKISKIENGVVTPTAHDVGLLARALGASEDDVQQLVTQAESLQDQFIDWSITIDRLTSGQQEIAHDEDRATRISIFQTGIVPGLLQTTEYARAVLSEYATLISGGQPGRDYRATPSAVTTRIQRQEVLYDARKQFEFVIAENVLATPVGSPADMLAQLQRIRTVTEQENIEIAILPSDAEVDFRALHGFHLFDDRVVFIDLISTTVVSRGHGSLRVYRSVFDHFRARATTELAPILDRYVIKYANAARAAAEHSTADD
jgi:transcriptional regulator with XRE-family HTH domain